MKPKKRRKYKIECAICRRRVMGWRKDQQCCDQQCAGELIARKYARKEFLRGGLNGANFVQDLADMELLAKFKAEKAFEVHAPNPGRLGHMVNRRMRIQKHGRFQTPY